MTTGYPGRCRAFFDSLQAMFTRRTMRLVLVLALAACSDEEEVSVLPTAVLGFEEVSREVGLASPFELRPAARAEFAERSEYPLSELSAELGGLAVGDVDLDGWLDVVVLGGSNAARVYLGQPKGEFVLDAGEGLELSPASLAPLLVDLTGDERPELLVPSAIGRGLQVFENRWPMPWRDVTAQLGLGEAAPSVACAAADVDGNGAVDLFLGRFGRTHREDQLLERPLGGLLWLRGSNEEFRDRSDWLELPLIERAPGQLLESVVAPHFADADNDGESDLWLTADFGATRLLRQLAASTARPDAGSVTDAAATPLDAAASMLSDASTADAAAATVSANGAADAGDARASAAARDGEAGDGWDDGADGGAAADAAARWSPDGALVLPDGGLSADVLKRALWGRGSLISRGYTGGSDPRFLPARDEVLGAASNAGGSALGDYDNDGDLDWFISGVALPGGVSNQFRGNRLLQNDGAGRFEDVTEAAGLLSSGWGRGSCMQDFDNDGRLDILQLSGIEAPEYQDDRLRLYLGSRREAKTFFEVAEAAGLEDAGQGRSVVCVDLDRDGDVDVLIGDAGGGLRLFRNRLDPNEGFGANYFGVRLVGRAPNTAALGARVSVRVGEVRQLREVQAASHLVPQGVSALHFGVGTARQLDELVVTWPNGDEQAVGGLGANELVVIRQPE